MNRCARCKAPIIWARTMASESGRGGKAMPLNAEPDPAGNVAVRLVTPTTRVCRVLGKGEGHDQRAEQLYMPHAATCLSTQGAQLVADLERFLAEAADS